MKSAETQEIQPDPVPNFWQLSFVEEVTPELLAYWLERQWISIVGVVAPMGDGSGGLVRWQATERGPFLVDYSVTAQRLKPDAPVEEGGRIVIAQRNLGRVEVLWTERTPGLFADRLEAWLKRYYGAKDADTVEAQDIAKSIGDRPQTYADSELRTTLVRYLIKDKRKTQTEACELAGVSQTTYLAHRKGGKLLSAEEFERRAGMSLAAAAENPELFKR